MFYRVFVPKQAVGASLIYFDLWVPTTATHRIELYSCLPVVSGAVAVTGVVGVDLHLTRTSAIGTGGTAMVAGGSSQTAMAIGRHNNDQANSLNSITGRLTPTGGATGSDILSWSSVFTEETNSATYNAPIDLARNYFSDIPLILINPGSGISVVQGAVASAGNIGFNLIIKPIPR